MVIAYVWNNDKIYHLAKEEGPDQLLGDTFCGRDIGSWLWSEKPPKNHRPCANCERKHSSMMKEDENANG
jgi:hypothetical protein